MESSGHPRAQPGPFDVYPPKAKHAGAIFIYLRKLQLLSNAYFKVLFLFVIKKERFLSAQHRVRLAGSELLKIQLDLRLGLLLGAVLPGSSSPLTPELEFTSALLRSSETGEQRTV